MSRGNRLAHALYTDFEARPRRERNFARYVFLDEATRTLYADCEKVAGDCLAMLRLYAGRHPDDPQLTELIGELSLHSDTFRRMWADHQVVAHTPEPASPSAEALGLLASWTGTSATGAHPREEKTDSAG
jgi:hypothetical protein